MKLTLRYLCAWVFIPVLMAFQGALASRYSVAAAPECAVSCDDGNACTTGDCSDPESGACIGQEVSCDDGNACTVEACDPTSGCLQQPISCDDNNACTADFCDPQAGCNFQPISCDDGDPNTVDSCNPAVGCENTMVDSDADSVPDAIDNCPDVPNADQADSDADLRGDACDACAADPGNDLDGDGVCDDVDNCPVVPNDQQDRDGDGQGNACDQCPNDADNDSDGDGVCGDVDNCDRVFNPDQTDTNRDGQGDACAPPTPEELIADLIHDVNGSGANQGVVNSLTVKLQNASSSIAGGKTQAACGQLKAFVSESKAQTGKALTAGEADALIREAGEIRSALGCAN
jgi:hypothetical protein